MSIKSYDASLIAVAVALALAAPALRAQSAPGGDNQGTPDSRAPSADAEQAATQEVIVTGTRQTGLEAAESPAPIQIVSVQELKDTGQATLVNALAQLVPSLVAQTGGTDMTNNTLQARLRGLSPNDVLILVNGKRRHTTANLAVISGPYQGGAGADLNFIPIDAIDHIEVLTEGAAAQYGSDAIAGVINIILKRGSSGGSADATYGQYFDGGGDTSQVGANVGFEPLSNSFFNVTAEDYNHGHSFRANVDPRVTDPHNIDPADGGTYPLTNMPYAPGYPYLALGGGDAEVHEKQVSYNSGFRLADGVQFYSFGTYGYKEAESFEGFRLPNVAYYENPTTGVYTYPYPYGFDPLEQAKETDYQLNGGFTGIVDDWTWDLGTGWGEDQFGAYTIDSINAQLYKNTGASPTNFYDGTFVAGQWTTTLDVARDFDVGLAGPLNIAWGGEYRREEYKILASNEPASYILGGGQSFPGFSPSNATNASRKSYAGYLDFAANPLSGVRLDVAGRYEHYSDFGDAKVGKVTARWDVVPAFAIRGTLSSGFRAPTLAEEHYTALNVGPTSAAAQLAPDGAAGALLGLGTGLKPERSTNLSLGLVFRPLDNLSATLDAYQILLTNRIVGSASFYGSINGTPYPGAGSVIAAIDASGLAIDPVVLATGTLSAVTFMNGIDTRTRGVDLTLQSPNDYPIGHIDWSIAGTYNYTALTREIATPAQLGSQAVFSPTILSNLTTASPRLVVNLGAHWTVSSFYVDLHEIIYGHSDQWSNDGGNNPQKIPIYYDNEIATIPITNLELGMHLNKRLTLAIGAQNLFDRYPNQINPAILAAYDAYYQSGGQGKYDTFSPFGFDGGFYYARTVFTF